jgi:hypothetical protein
MTPKERPPGGESRGSEIAPAPGLIAAMLPREGAEAYRPDLELVAAVRRITTAFPGAVFVGLVRR